jgi:hypothetical protein
MNDAFVLGAALLKDGTIRTSCRSASLRQINDWFDIAITVGA